MRFPFSLTRSLAAYLLRKKLSGQQRFPLVLMLEPLHACNLTCTGCGRIREYAGSIKQRLSIDECLAAVDECEAPVVSFCGGEPLIYPEVGRLVKEIIRRKRHVYLCTNGVYLEKKLDQLPRSKRLFLNVHLDGMESTHDRLVERPGVFAAAVHGIRAAKQSGYQVCTNTTVYRETDRHEIAVLFNYLTELGVDGMLISPSYGYQAVKELTPQAGQQLFMTRDDIHAWFRAVRHDLQGFRLASTPIYLDFLCGLRELSCAAWACPTRNIRGWKGPCYLITDGHWKSYRELLENTDWESLGPGRDPRCEHCLMHCGFEPAATLESNRNWRDMWRMAVWQFAK